MPEDKHNISNMPHLSIPQTFTLFQVVVGAIFILVITIGSTYVTMKVNETSYGLRIAQLEKDLQKLEITVKENDNKQLENYKKLAGVFDYNKGENQTNILKLQSRIDDVSTSVDSLYAKMIRRK